MVSFWSLVNNVIERADVLLLVLDARMIKETRNLEIERKILHTGKPLIYVITKCDLVEKNIIQKYQQRLKPSVFTSSTEYHGTKMLKERIHIEATKAKLKQGIIRVGVLGYPNVGKSSLINAMKGSKAAPTSALSGYTRAIQNIKTSSKIVMIDTPGVLPQGEKDFMKQAIAGSLDFTKTQEPDVVIMEIISKFPGTIEKFYGVKSNEDEEETIEAIALKNKILKRGGSPDTKRMARMILGKWQRGEIKK